MRSFRLPLIALALCANVLLPARAQDAEERSQWNQPVEPFRIFGPLYYVGAKEVASYAIATPEGLILLDGGLPETAPRVLESLGKLGFRIEDVKLLLNSHSHFDHAGGLAELKRRSGARLLASEGDADQLEAGGRGDFAWGDQFQFPAVAVDRRLADGDTVGLGGVTLTANVTAGHTKGCTTWTATFEEAGERLAAVFFCSASVPDPPNYRLADNPRYPQIARDYAASFARLRTLPCDLFLASHGSFFALEAKAARLRAGDRHAFVDPAGFRALVERSEKRFRELLAAAEGEVAARAAATSPGGGTRR